MSYAQTSPMKNNMDVSWHARDLHAKEAFGQDGPNLSIQAGGE